MPDENASSVIANCNNSAIRSGTRELGIPSLTQVVECFEALFGYSQLRAPLPWSRPLNVITNGKCLKTWHGGTLLTLSCSCSFSDESLSIWWALRVCAFSCSCRMFSSAIWNKKKTFLISLKWNLGLSFWLIVRKKERKLSVINATSFPARDRISPCGFLGRGLRLACNLYHCNSFILSANYRNIIVRT